MITIITALFIIGCKLADKASDKDGKNKTMQAVQD